MIKNFRTRYHFRNKDWPESYATINNEPSLTQQSDIADSEINIIGPKYIKTGIATVTSRKALFGDFTQAPTFADAQQMILAAEDAFEALPAKVRERFDNQTGKLVEFLLDPDNKDQAIKLGLIDKPADPPNNPQAPATQAPAPADTGTGEKK